MSTSIAPKDFNVGGIRVHVYARPGVLPSPGDAPVTPAGSSVSVLFALHGRMGDSSNEDIVATAVEALNFVSAQEKEAGEAGRELIVVTFDHRNHGERTVDSFGNQGWSKAAEKHNERHAVDMYAIQTGTAKDVSFLIDFLPAYLFPSDERTITTWGMLGVSLGGHATWLTLKNDPRLTVGIPVIGCPDYLTLLELRADKHGLSLAPPYMPASLRAYIKAHDPVTTDYASTSASNPFGGKRILVLSGAEDPLVQWTASATFIEGLQVGPSGLKEVKVLEGVKHEYTPQMRETAIQFGIWEEMVRK
ncbi:hypothetical protein PENSPDRAFT_742562 [Peniophora sp. CONT]|nr:hypothetical protein PENSPDRAFT_742562 [Peniophora sp. CONT]